jgi:hypothetical protein
LKIKFGDIVSGIEEDSEDLGESKKKSKVDKLSSCQLLKFCDEFNSITGFAAPPPYKRDNLPKLYCSPTKPDPCHGKAVAFCGEEPDQEGQGEKAETHRDRGEEVDNRHQQDQQHRGVRQQDGEVAFVCNLSSRRLRIMSHGLLDAVRTVVCGVWCVECRV